MTDGMPASSGETAFPPTTSRRTPCFVFPTSLLHLASPPAMTAVVEKHSHKDQSTGTAVQVTTPAIGDEKEFPDGGLRAWLVVAGCFVVNSVTVSFW